MCVDVLSRNLWAVPLKNKTAELVSKHIEKIVSKISNFRVIQTDQGLEFSTLNIPGIKVIKSQSYTPQNQGTIERLNGTIKRVLN